MGIFVLNYSLCGFHNFAISLCVNKFKIFNNRQKTIIITTLIHQFVEILGFIYAKNACCVRLSKAIPFGYF